MARAPRITGARPRVKRTPPRIHIAFTVESREAVHRFRAAALGAGGTDHGVPGPRSDYGPTYYAASVLDPAGNNVEAVCLAPEGA